jgi:two-component sensor histidine kinase
MALIHQLMYEGKDLSRVDLGEYLQGLVRLAQESYGADRRRVSIRLEAAKVFLDLQRAVPCGLLVNELISNAFKHAFPDGRVGEIKVCLKPIGGEMVLSVRDNGVGLPQGLNVSATRSLGLQLVKLLADQVGARLTVGSAPGTCFELRFDAIEEALA